MEEVPWPVIWPGFDGEAAARAPPLEISDQLSVHGNAKGHSTNAPNA